MTITAPLASTNHSRDKHPTPSRPSGHLSVTDLTDLVAAVAADPAAWRPHLQLPEPEAGRWWTRLSTNPTVDVWLLSWSPGQTTELHDHGPSVAAFTVVEGELVEARATPGTPRTVHTRNRGSVTAIPLGVLHDVTGAGTGPAVSIHAYSPPLTEMNYYDADLTVTRTVRTHEPEEELVR